MDTVNAAMLLASFKYLKKKRKKLSEIKKYYEKNLSKKIVLQKFNKNEKPGLYAFPIQVKSRNKIKRFLEKKNIETKIWNSPLICDSPAYKKYKTNKLPVARKVLSRTLNIPFHENMTDDQKATIWPELRRAESTKFALMMKRALENTEAFGAVRVVPNQNSTGDLYVLGKIDESTGEDIEIDIKVVDISGKTWLDTRNRLVCRCSFLSLGSVPGFLVTFSCHLSLSMSGLFFAYNICLQRKLQVSWLTFPGPLCH